MIRVVAFGGGHGLSATLRALCCAGLPVDLTAVVTVGDDGGSSGILRAQRGVLPPGDLRQALCALSDRDELAALMQYRFAGPVDFAPDDPLAGHAVGNLVLAGLMEQLGDPVAALDRAGQLMGSAGRVLPMTRQAVSLEADVAMDKSRPDDVVTVRGQHEVAVSTGDVRTVRLDPPAPAATREALAAIGRADWLIFGPGSWYTSVIPHLLLPELAGAIVCTAAKRLVTLNLAAERETENMSLPDHLGALSRYLPALRIDVVLADQKAVGDPGPVRNAAESLGARLALAPVAVDDGSARHDPVALGAAYQEILTTMPDQPAR
jgi:uncharacterized cofD-like protein